MKFPIDVIWLDVNGRVVTIAPNMSPCLGDRGYCPSYLPDRDFSYILEISAGFTQRHSVEIGTQIHFHNV